MRLNFGYILCSMCSSKLQGSTLHSLYEEEEQADIYTPFQCFTSPTQTTVQALELHGLDKLISTSYGDSYVREQWWILLLLLYPSSNIFTAHHYCIKPVIVILTVSNPLGPYLGCIWLQASTECEGVKLCASTGCVEPLPGHWVQCCTDGGHEQWWVEKSYFCGRQWRNTGMWASAAYYIIILSSVHISILSSYSSVLY